jgi:hypothetical protein
MTPPHSSTSGNKSFAVYVVMYALAISSLVVDVQRGSAFFSVLGIVTSILLTTFLAYRMARAMAFSPTASRPAPMPVSISQASQAA